MSKIRNIATLPLDGGALCFHFINTVHSWKGANVHEYLGSYEELVQWCRKVDILTEQSRKALLQYAAAHPGRADKALQRIWRVRRLLYHFFSALAAGRVQQLPAGVMQRFNTVIAAALSRIRFTARDGQLITGWDEAPDDLLAPLWPVLKSAYDILTTTDHRRIKECEACGWMFLDQTKNNKRRWCNPLSCGSIEKARKYYEKKKRLGQWT